MLYGLRLLIITLALHFVTASAMADSCEDARKQYDESDKAPLLRSLESMNGLMFTQDPAVRQKIACEHEQNILKLNENGVRYHRRIDNACGKRIRWKTCDTACAIEGVRKQEKKVAYECAPARVTEAIEKDRREKEERERKAKAELAVMNAQFEREMPLIEACGHLGPFWNSRSTDKERAGWIKQCNDAPREYCVGSWISLEKGRLSTSGLTCRPTAEERAKERAESKRADDLAKSPERKYEMACDKLLFAAQEKGETKADDLRLCNEASGCDMYRSLLKDQFNRQIPGLTCPKSK